MTTISTQSVPVIAIDGPTASGKGTVAQRVAEALGFHYLDSGALYRLVGLASFKAGVSTDSEPDLIPIAEKLNVIFQGDRVFLADEDVTDVIRQEAMGKRASEVAVHPGVRAALVARQQAFRQAPGLVADGRDMASVIFQDAITKVFLTASVEARAERRYKQLIAKGFSANMSILLQDLRDRDARDANRSTSPLKAVEGAHHLDTTSMTIEEAVNQVLAWYKAS
ncbi:(d)CMP kinase [Polynucleobacter sp. MWH-Spelu-300-X4]|uniref:(d)CMP kinase n=1 Tax=Polynucleobacter sp. MWH-Spelu-300-X4 TaxID=2689109 RepID=UPI001BFDBFAE|nr:(d)CMP kinase [Polynucleobacter sp. MWH-Spelu-300-X4]QWD80230.1 (d)CMP kinase [Polynucleobacter sp. MWH-Spelu-300-X4]